MEYVIGPVLALLIGMKFTHYTSKRMDRKLEECVAEVDTKILEQNTQVSTQTLKVLTPVAMSINKINKQLGLWDKISKK